ncbi:MAG: ABC transporter permease [Armatimonadetes bacterium]|nr:ABC transporter permease [Planctomycetota bacterium]NUP98427.1 ABC transporter permease [Armatimonadota bacterium]
MSAPPSTPAKPAETIGRSQLPLREALAFSLQSLLLRVGRMLVVILGISFAIAFLAVLLGTERIMGGLEVLAAKQSGTVDEAAAGAASFRRWWIAVALLIAVTGITNAVLLSVTERIKEIGTLKCLGARGLHIVELFLLEMLLLGALGGLIGGLLGVFGTVVLFFAQLGGDLWRVFGFGDAWYLLWMSVAVSLGVSLVSAVIPVLLAAKIEPAEAMRYEV